MRWTERQRAMLMEIGVRLWPEAEDAEPVAVAAEVAVAPPPHTKSRSCGRKACFTIRARLSRRFLNSGLA